MDGKRESERGKYPKIHPYEPFKLKTTTTTKNTFIGMCVVRDSDMMHTASCELNSFAFSTLVPSKRNKSEVCGHSNSDQEIELHFCLYTVIQGKQYLSNLYFVMKLCMHNESEFDAMAVFNVQITHCSELFWNAFYIYVGIVYITWPHSIHLIQQREREKKK